MAKIVKFKSKEPNIVAELEKLLDMAKNGEIENFILAAKMNDGNVLSGWFNADIGERQYLVAHLQVDVTFQVTQVNADQLIEYL